MRHYKSNLDACYGAILVVIALVAFLFSCYTIDFVLHTDPRWASRHRIYYPLACLLCFIFVARWQLFHSGIRWWVYLGLLISPVYVIMFQSGWFRDELHDLALEYFRSHGRFGCHDDNYSSYIFRDDTAPWIMFGPFILATVLHWIYRTPEFFSLVRREAISSWRWITTYEKRTAA